ncbi:16S rRNA m(7)G-527 methyltransferase [Dyella jiangningensis]|uniref:16S rRNA (guanine(527)-N(7))-methyltransferase RsmG n=1 Tax=Dyella sp. AtDHG13 TaxID=1938897 RepID=UPI000883B81C|nr:16S rRNA (guanine(527)-N(7))-methyltransferase RsmG [Dyella sp. AtDHG13]PXV57005.1 16S rRNA m(7)G-527 methyltransferase [Dyella sp. AtDHG13]SDK63770.1 16S rRNA m(7)G-527 methyltransferase [Dyella jiangningensis]
MTSRTDLQTRLERGIAALGVSLPAGAADRLLDYQALLARWNATYNLTAIRDPGEMVSRHLVDSLAILPYVQGQTLADLGTGPGLPGIPLAIAAPERQVLLVDSNGKKVRFLREAIRSLKLENVRAVQSRVEEVEGQFDCITARAFASLEDMLAWGGHLLTQDGIWLAMKGKHPDDELPGVPAGFEVRAIHTLDVPDVGGERHLVVLGRTAG